MSSYQNERRLCVNVKLRGVTGGGATPSKFHTLAKTCLLTHFTIGLRPCIISSFLLQIYLPPPPLKITQLRPSHSLALDAVIFLPA